MSEVVIFYPNKQPDGQGFAYHRLPHVAGKDLRGYLHDVKLVALRLHARCTLERTAEVLRLNYVPQPSDRIVLRRTRGM